MKKISAMFLMALTLGLATTAQAEPVKETPTEELVRRLENHEFHPAEIAAFLATNRSASAYDDITYKVMVDCDIARMVKAGKYTRVNDNITQEKFPEAGCKTGQVELQLFHLGHVAYTESIMRELDRRGLRPATLPELLALGATHPDPLHRFVLVALGSQLRTSDSTVEFPILGGNSCMRDLNLVKSHSGGVWSGRARFVGVPK